MFGATDSTKESALAKVFVDRRLNKMKELYHPGERVFFFDGKTIKEGNVVGRSSGSQGFIKDDQGFFQHILNPYLFKKHWRHFKDLQHRPPAIL